MIYFLIWVGNMEFMFYHSLNQKKNTFLYTLVCTFNKISKSNKLLHEAFE